MASASARARSRFTRVSLSVDSSSVTFSVEFEAPAFAADSALAAANSFA